MAQPDATADGGALASIDRRRRSAADGRRLTRSGGADPTHARDLGAQPLDPGHPDRIAGAGRRHVRRPLPARRVRLRRPEPELDGDDRLLGRLRRVLLRAHLRAAADRHRAADPAPRTPRRTAPRRVPGVEGAVLCPFLLLVVVPMLAVLRLFDRLPIARTTTYAYDRHRAPAHVRPPPWRSDCSPRRSSQPRPGDARPADALLPGRPLLRGDPPGAPDGGRRRRSARSSPTAGRSRPSVTTSGPATSSRRAARPLGQPLLVAYGDAGTLPTGVYWLYLAAFTVVFAVGAWLRATKGAAALARADPPPVASPMRQNGGHR